MAIFTAIVGAFTAVSAFIGGLGVIGSFVLKTAVGVGLSLLASAIAGKPKRPDQPGFSVQGKLQAGGDLPRSIMMGYAATAGSLVYANTWGNSGDTPNAFVTQVIAVSDVPVAGLAGVIVNGEHCTLDTGATPSERGLPVVEYRKDGKDHLWIKFYAGDQTEADPFLVSKVSSAQRPYETTRVGVGIAYAICTALVAESLFTGFPTFRFEIDGMKLYDPSKDTTAGGDGAHRWGEPSTWGGDGDNLPAVQIYNMLRGITWGGKWLYGLQNMAGPRLPAAHWIGQIDKCRALIDGVDGPEPTYRSGGEFQVSARIADAVTALLTACHGKLAETGGVYKVHLGAPEAPVYAFADGDILSSEEQSFTPFYGLADTINGITATYPSPAEGWNTKTAPPLHNPDYEAEDGNRRLLADSELNLVPYDGQVQRLMLSALNEARRARRHTFVLSPAAWVLEPGDIVSWTSARNGYATKLFRIDGVADKANLDVMLDITEVDPSDYDWDQGTDFQPPVTGPIGPVRPSPQPIKDWYAEPVVITGEDGAQRPGIRLSWDGDQADIDGVLWQVRRAVSGIVVHEGGTDNPSVGSVIITQSLLRNSTYQTRGRYRAISGREMTWSGWITVTTPNVQLGYYDISAANRIDALRSQMDALADNYRRLAKLVSNDQVVTANDLREVRIERDAGDVRVTAGYRDEIDLVVTSMGGLADRTQALEVTVDTPTTGLSARVGSHDAAIADLTDGAAAMAQSVLDVTAKTDAGTANGNVKITAISAPTGVAAAYEMQISAEGPTGTFVTAGEEYYVVGDGTSYKRTNAKIVEWGFYDDVGAWQRGMYFDAVKKRLVTDRLLVTGESILPGKIVAFGTTPYNAMWVLASSSSGAPTYPDIKAGFDNAGATSWYTLSSLSFTLADKSDDDPEGYLFNISGWCDGVVYNSNNGARVETYLRITKNGSQISRTPFLAGKSDQGSAPGTEETHVKDLIPNTGGSVTYAFQIGVKTLAIGGSFGGCQLTNLHFVAETIVK